MSKKIAFIGAGSVGFTRGLVADIISYPAFEDVTIALMDISKERLEMAKKSVERIVQHFNKPVKIIATTSRKEALRGADGVLITILAGGVQVWRHDIEIPKKYGVDINVGDTRGVSGVFRALRTIPVMLDICKDIECYCPNAIVLNYTNPMAMLCRAMQAEFPKLKISGLCHSVQGTARELAKMINAPFNEITYLCAGINHQAWYLNYEWKGKDAYPLLRKAVEEKKNYMADVVRIEMFRHLGYYVTESAGHNSEYVPWFRKRPDLIKKYCVGTGWNPGAYAMILKMYLAREKRVNGIPLWKKEVIEWIKSDKVAKLGGRMEYAANIFNAVFGDNNIFEFNGNVRNFTLIDNLPYGCCVEVPVEASKNGLRPVHVGKLPDHLALLNNISARCEELAVEGAISGNPNMVYQAVYFDPLTSAVLSLKEINEMVYDLFMASKAYLPQFKKYRLKY